MTLQKHENALRFFRFLAITEGISYLVLLFISMPLKYIGDIPEPVQYVGWIHGFLFVALGISALQVYFLFKKKFIFLLKTFLAAIIPFGTFILERNMRRENMTVDSRE